MTVAYFDCFSGISGDMILGALVDAGVPFEELKAALAGLPVEGYEISCRRVQRCGIGGSQVQVKLTDHAHSHEHEHSHGHTHDNEHNHSHSDEHAHPHEHSHSLEHSDEHVNEEEPVHEKNAGHGHSHDDRHHHDHAHETHDHSHGQGLHTHSHSHEAADEPTTAAAHGHRGFSEIKRIIEASSFTDLVKQRAIAAFHRIAVEEAAVHETTIESVHFHEVGAVDAIVDIVGAMWCVERLGITRVLASPVAVGSGTIRVAHGEMPIPAPATARLLAGVPICTGPVTGELTTPTGAAILTTLAETFGPLENFKIDKVAYGAGTREYPEHTNYLRVLLGQAQSGAVEAAGGKLPVLRETLTLITAEIDDMPAELLGAALESLIAAGALDCHFVPVQMKKNRPAVSLHVLANHQRIDALLTIIFKETSTFGVKLLPCERLSLRRRQEKVRTQFGEVKVKLGLWGETVLRTSPEYEDCCVLAKERGVPVMEVYNAAMAAATVGAGRS